MRVHRPGAIEISVGGNHGKDRGHKTSEQHTNGSLKPSLKEHPEGIRKQRYSCTVVDTASVHNQHLDRDKVMTEPAMTSSFR